MSTPGDDASTTTNYSLENYTPYICVFQQLCFQRGISKLSNISHFTLHQDPLTSLIKKMEIRQTRQTDVAPLKTLLDQIELFPSDMLPDMIAEYLSGDIDQSIWLTARKDSQIIGFCYAAAEMLTEGTWNLRAIGVLPSAQENGVGSALTRKLEDTLHGTGQRILIVDTSGKDGFHKVHKFYQKNGYTKVSTIPDFWAEGDDKVTYWKSLK